MVVAANVVFQCIGREQKGSRPLYVFITHSSCSTILRDECKLAHILKYMSYTLCCMVLCNLCWELMFVFYLSMWITRKGNSFAVFIKSINKIVKRMIKKYINRKHYKIRNKKSNLYYIIINVVFGSQMINTSVYNNIHIECHIRGVCR